MTTPVSNAPGSIIGYRKNGLPIRLIAGGSGESETPPEIAPSVAPPVPVLPVATPVVSESGFPENTPVAEMNAAQQTAYWKHQARKHEDRVKGMGDYETLKANAAAAQALLDANKTDSEKALDAAKAEARAEALKEVGSKLVDANFTAFSAGRISDEQRTALLAGLNQSAFLTATGDVDTEKLKTFVDGIAPAATSGGAGKPPVDLGQGRRGGNATPTVETGKSRWAERHPTK